MLRRELGRVEGKLHKRGAVGTRKGDGGFWVCGFEYVGGGREASETDLSGNEEIGIFARVSVQVEVFGARVGATAGNAGFKAGCAACGI